MKQQDFFEYEDMPKVAYSPEMARALGSLKAAIFLSQLLFYMIAYEKRHDRQIDWFFKSQADFERDTFLSRYEQQKAREVLRKKKIIEERKGRQYLIQFRVDYVALDKIMPACGFLASRLARKPRASSRENHKQLARKPRASSRENPELSYETSKEINETRQGRLPFSFFEEISQRFLQWRKPWERPDQKHKEIAI